MSLTSFACTHLPSSGMGAGPCFGPLATIHISSTSLEYEASINYTETNAEDAAKLIAQYEIVPKEPIALKALPGCNIHFIKGEEMKEKASGYLQVLFDADPKSVGGTLPDDAFYYTE